MWNKEVRTVSTGKESYLLAFFSLCNIYVYVDEYVLA